eukprot:COSAG01_NODE_7103_length_3353_cov_1.565458_4_plen_69_part_00
MWQPWLLASAMAACVLQVLLGRPVLWGLAWDGEAGVETVLSNLAAELTYDLRAVGCAGLGQVGPHILR